MTSLDFKTTLIGAPTCIYRMIPFFRSNMDRSNVSLAVLMCLNGESMHHCVSHHLSMIGLTCQLNKRLKRLIEMLRNFNNSPKIHFSPKFDILGLIGKKLELNSISNLISSSFDHWIVSNLTLNIN